MQKFSEADKEKWENLLLKHEADLTKQNAEKISNLEAILSYRAKKVEELKYDKFDKAKAKKDLNTSRKSNQNTGFDKTKNQFFVKQEQFLISKIDARNGAFGIVTNDLDKAVIMADFLNYDIDKNIINDKFLIAVFKTPYYMEPLNSSSSGTTGRKRINEQKLLNLCICLPPLTAQNKLILRQTKVDEEM